MPPPLYNRDILRLAASNPCQGRLSSPDATIEKRSQTCGSTVVVDIKTDEQGRIIALGMDVHACALGQASASLMATNIDGRTLSEIRNATLLLKDMLSGKEPNDESMSYFPGISILAVAREYPARHPSIMLPFEAVTQALEQVERAVVLKQRDEEGIL